MAEIITDSSSKKGVTEKLSRWRKDDATANKKVKYIYKSIDEVIEQGKDVSAIRDRRYLQSSFSCELSPSSACILNAFPTFTVPYRR